MKYLQVQLHNTPGTTRRFLRVLFLSGSLLAGSLGVGTSAYASAITDGTYISDSYYDGGSAVGGYGSPSGFYYTDGILGQTDTISDPASPYASASATASLASDQLSLSLTGSNGSTAGTAEMWDTLTLGNLPSGGTVNNNTVLGTLTMTVSGSIGTATYGAAAYAGYSLDLYNTGSFGPVSYAGSSFDCGGGSSCTGLLSQSTYGSTLFSPGTSTFSVPVTLGDLTSGQVAYIAEITATNYSDPSLSAPLAIDPSIALTGLYPGVTVSSTSGYNYAAPVPLPPALWFFVSGLLGLAVCLRPSSTTAKR